MRIFLLGLVLSCTTLFSSHAPLPYVITTPATENVYICASSGAYAYHSDKDCRGLGRCTHTIKKITESEAINTYKRKKCKICY